VSTRSVSKEERALADLIVGELRGAGLTVARQDNNLWTTLGDAERPRLLLNSHLDTVPPSQGWTGDPWTPRFEPNDGRLSGLGANDAKGCVAALIEAVLRWKRRMERGERLGGTIVLALTAEEETSGNGLGAVLERLKPIDAGIVGEPTDLTPMTAQRGLLIVKGVAHGRTAHPGNTPPERAENAIQIAADDITRLREFDWGPTHPLLGRCHAHVTIIQGGVARNVIPDACEFFLDIRTTPLEAHPALFERLRRFLKSELVIHSQRLVPVQTDDDERIVRAVGAALRGKRTAGSPTMSDMVYLAGIPAVKIGPGQSARSHTPDEYILAGELAAGAEAYERIIGQYFSLSD